MGAQIAMGGGAVISGMALGIDGAAMEGALGRDGRVIGVLGGGVDIVYPAGNRKLYERLVRQGCLISEYPPGFMPQKWTFPRRNRIISGLSCGVLVVEAPRSSGALITAQQALEQGRDVFAVPGNVNSVSSAGSNDLLKQGAAVVTTGWDILETYQYRFPDQICKVPGCDDPAMRLPDTGVSRQPADQNLGKVAQNPIVPENCRKENQKNDRNVIDNSQLPPYSDVNKPILKLTPQAEKILQTLSERDMPVDELIYRSGIPAAQVISTLTLLEIKGLIRRLPGKIIHRVEP
jgi:DNA processing protein